MSNVKTPDLLAAEVRKRRLVLGIATVKELAELAGFTVKTGSSIENARQDAYRPQTLAQLDRALQWEPGSSQSLLDDGAEPTPIPSSNPSTSTTGAEADDGSVWESFDSADAVLIPSSALEGLDMEERAEVMSVARAAGLQRAREIKASHRAEEAALPDVSQLAARTVARRPQWNGARDGSESGEESQDR